MSIVVDKKEIKYKQIIIARKDLDMSPGKLSSQVSHASMAFLTRMIRNNAKKGHLLPLDSDEYYCLPDEYSYSVKFSIDRDLYEKWIDGSFTKCILSAKNKNQLLKAIKWAEEIGLKENKEFFVIRDNCNTELTPEEYDEDGIGRTTTCIGFIPLPDYIIDQIGKKYRLY